MSSRYVAFDMNGDKISASMFSLVEQLISLKVFALIISSRFMTFDTERDKISALVFLLVEQLISFKVFADLKNIYKKIEQHKAKYLL